MNLQKNKGQITWIFNVFQILIVIKDTFKYSWGVGRYLQIVTTLYPLSILILHSLKKQSGEFYIFSLILIRPDILLIQAIGLWGLRGYLVSALIYLIQKLSFGFFLFTQKVRIESNLNKFNKWIYFYLAIYQTFFFQVLLIPLTLICMQSYNSGFIQQDIVSIFFSIFMFILLQLDAIFFLYLNESALTYRLRALDKTKITFYDVISYTLKIAQIALFGVYQDNAVYPYILTILIFFISIIEMANQYINQSYIHRSNRLVLYAMNLLAATISFFYFIDLQSQNSNLTFSFTLLLYPLILQLILHIDKDQFSHKEHNLPHLFHQLIKVVNYCDTQDLKKSIKFSLILSRHKDSCKEIQCFCSHNYNFIDITNSNLGRESVEKKFFQSRFNFISKIIFKNRTYPQTLFKFCSLLYTFDYQIQATKYFYLTLGMSAELSDDISLFNTNSKQRHSSHSLSESHHRHNKQTQFYKRYSLSLLLELKIKYLISEVKRKMNIQLSNQTHSQHEFSEQIQKFYKNEGQLQQNINQIKKVLFEKIQFYIEFTKQKELDFDKFSQSVINYNQTIIKLATKLKKRYSYFPSKKLLQIICYLESEINNDLSEGFKYQNMNAISEEKLLQLSSNAFFNFYSDDVSYIIFEVEEDLQNLTIQSCSSNFKFSGQQLTLAAVLPGFIVHEHPILVGNFLKLGQSKFYRKFKQSFIRNKDGFTGSMQLCFDTIHSLESDKMTFIAFIKQSQEYSAFLMIDINKQIGSMTKIVLQKCGYSEDFILQYGITEKLFNSIPITHLIPSFDSILEENKDMHIIRANNIKFYFYDLQQYQDEINDHIHPDINNVLNIRDQCRMIEYRIDIVINQHEIYEFYYFILELLVVNKLTKEQIIKDNFTNRCSSEFNITELNMSLDELQINQISNHSESQNERSQDKIQQKEDLYNEMNIEQELQLQSPNQSNIDRSTQQLKFYTQTLMAHPQQQYFNKQNNISFDQQQSNISKLANELSEQKKQDQEASKPSSIYGVRSYKYFKKYELYNRASKRVLSKPLQICTAFLLLQLLINIIFSNIILTILHSDIARFIKEIDMIALHASIMGPHDLFYGVRATISAYQQLNREGYIDKELTEELVDPLYKYIGLGYEELRVNFYELLSNQYLQDFFTNVTRTAYFMKDNDTNVYPLTLNFKEQLLVELAYQFQFKRTFEKRGSAAGKAFQVFQYANYFKLHQTLETLTQQIMQYSRNRSDQVQSKWEIIWIFFLLTHFLICCIILYYLNYQSSLNEKFLKLFLYVDPNLLKIELERLKELFNVIEKNPDYVLEYKFVVQDKSVKNISNSSQLSNRYMKTNDKHEKYKLTRVYAIIQMLLFFGIFCLYSTLINQKTSSYLDRYKETTEFYKLIQDLRFRSGNIYLYREIRMRWSNFTYLTDEDYNLLYGLIDDSKSVMKTYLYDYITPQFDKYLCSDSFVQFYFSVQNTDLCNFITQDYLQFMGRYCTAGLEGTVVEGMIPCLTFILNSIETQQAVNNFTHREEVYFYEAESGYIVTRVFVNMSEQLKTGMIEITESKNQFDNVLSGLNLTFCIVLGFLALFVLRDYYNNQFYYVRKIINLLPICVLVNDDSLERILRLYLVSQDF